MLVCVGGKCSTLLSVDDRTFKVVCLLLRGGVVMLDATASQYGDRTNLSDTVLTVGPPDLWKKPFVHRTPEYVFTSMSWDTSAFNFFQEAHDIRRDDDLVNIVTLIRTEQFMNSESWTTRLLVDTEEFEYIDEMFQRVLPKPGW